LKKRTCKLTQNPSEFLEKWCSDLQNWPQSWAGDQDDVITGEKLTQVFRGYLLDLISIGRSRKTIKKHATYLWCLGGEIIRDTNEYGADSSLSDGGLLLRYINSDGGLYWPYASSESDLLQYDSVCRMLYKYVKRK